MKKIIIASIMAVTLATAAVGFFQIGDETADSDNKSTAQNTKSMEVEQVPTKEEINTVKPTIVAEPQTIKEDVVETPVIQPVETTDQKFDRLIMTTYEPYNKYGMSAVAYTLKNNYPYKFTADKMDETLKEVYAEYETGLYKGNNMRIIYTLSNKWSQEGN